MRIIQKPFFALALSCVLFSCTNNESISSGSDTTVTTSNYEVIAPAALPTKIANYISTNYTGAITTEVNLNSDGTYVTYVAPISAQRTIMGSAAKRIKLKFTAKGDLNSAKTETSVAVADLLPAITTYITTNYPAATINVAHSETGGSFDVLITAADGSKIKLDFTADGTFESARIFRANGNHKHHHDGKQTPVAIADLATSITNYITANYIGATITSAHKESDSSFDVFITTSEGAHLNLNFSANGEFISVSSNGNNHSNHETEIAVADLLTDISTYITTNYAGATIVSAEKDWNGGFEVHLTTATGVRLELNFTNTGEFVVGSDSNNNHFEGPIRLIVKDLIIKIKNFITDNYPGATIKEAQLESDGSYDVTIITATGTKLKLTFTVTGDFISVKND
jgi:hypothetical protein